MADRPILFSAPMVLALLAGAKTQTRRIAGVPVIEQTPNGLWHIHNRHGGEIIMTPAFSNEEIGREAAAYLPIQPGDRLWIKETLECANDEAVGYPADGAWLPNTPWAWKRDKLPGIYMPRWASRITLTVTDVRVQRLQDISEEDALAEGVVPRPSGLDYWVPGVEHPNPDFPYLSRPTAREMYAALWDVINGSGAWGANPWVAAYTFTVEQRNIDAREAA